jgi:hypothetical protein
MFSFSFSMFFNERITWGYLSYQQIPSTQDYLGLPLVPANSIYAGLPVAPETLGLLGKNLVPAKTIYAGRGLKTQLRTPSASTVWETIIYARTH